MSIGDCTRTPEVEQALQVVAQLARLVFIPGLKTECRLRGEHSLFGITRFMNLLRPELPLLPPFRPFPRSGFFHAQLPTDSATEPES